MARVTKKATKNTLKRKKPGKRQNGQKPSPKVAVHEETAGESETDSTHARALKKKHHKKYKERIKPDPTQRRFETPMLHFNPDTQAFKKREEAATENMADIDDRDVTSSHRDQDNWSLDNLPDILYVLRPKIENAKSRRVVHMTDHMIFGKKVKNFYALPPRISSQVEGFRLEAWFRLDRRIKPEDILDRVNPMFKHLISEDVIQERRASFQLAYNVADWTSQKSINAVTRQVKRAGIDVEQNTTRGVTPGLIDPAKGETGGRVVFKPAAMDRKRQAPDAWCKTLQSKASGDLEYASLADSHKVPMQQENHGAEQGTKPANAQLMRLAYSHMAATVSNQDNRVNQLSQINYYAAPGSTIPAIGGSYVAHGQQQYHPQVAQVNNPMLGTQPMQTSHPMQAMPAQGDHRKYPRMAGQFPTPRTVVPAVNARMNSTRVKPNGSPFLSTATLPASPHISPASARMARAGTPYQRHAAQVNQYPVPRNGYQQGMSSAQMAHAANPATTGYPNIASNNFRVPQFSSELYPFYDILGSDPIYGQGSAFGGANTYSSAHTGQKRSWEVDNYGVPVLMDKRQRSDPFGIEYPTEVPELAAHSGPVPEEFAENDDEEPSQEVNFDDWLVESAMSADGHIEWRSGIWPGIGVDPDKTEEEKEKEKEEKEKEEKEKEKKEKDAEEKDEEEEDKKEEDKEKEN